MSLPETALSAAHPRGGEIGETLVFEDAGQWRRWLEQNHDRCHDVWLVNYRKQAKRRSLPFREALEEALCYGWVDGVATNVDAESFLIHFSRRDRAGNWPSAQRKKLQRLVSQGRVTEAGLAVAPADLGRDGGG